MSMPIQAPSASDLAVRTDGKVPVLTLPSKMKFEALRALVREQMPDAVDVLAGRSVRLDLGDRDIVLFDLRRLVHLLRDEFGVEVTGLYVDPAVMHRFAERELKLKLFVRPEAPTVAPEPMAQPEQDEPVEEVVDVEPADDVELDDVVENDEPPEIGEAIRSEPEPTPEEPPATLQAEPEPAVELGRRTLTVHRTLRSGTSVRFDGDVTVFGDVNPGAQIEAAGNIVVLGALKGMVHAGAKGDDGAFILSFDLRPTQVRIGRKIAIPPERTGLERVFEPELATVQDGQIVIEPYRGPLSR